ncbi:MAG: hypothetical protein GY930_02545 [bacterium]|nr:hypothetical protein [bacterium]
MTELQLRQQQGDMAMDAFQERLRRSKEQDERADLRLQADLETGKLNRTLAEQKFRHVTAQDARQDRTRLAMAEASEVLYRLVGEDSQLSAQEMENFEDALEGFDPLVRAEMLGRGQKMRMAQVRAETLKRQEQTRYATEYIIENAESEDERERLMGELQTLRLTTPDEGEYSEAVDGLQLEMLGRKASIAEHGRWSEKLPTRIEGAELLEGESLEAYSLKMQMDEIGLKNPRDPRMAEMKSRIEWLITPQSQKNQIRQLEAAQQQATQTLETLGMVGQEQVNRMEQVRQVQAGINGSLVRGSYAEKEEARGRRLTAGLKAAGLDIDLDVLLPADMALPQQLEYAFQAMQQADIAMSSQGQSAEMIRQHQRDLLERSGIEPSEDAMNKLVEWGSGKLQLDTKSWDHAKVGAANIYKKEKRDVGEDWHSMDRKEIGDEWLEIFKVNKTLKKKGMPLLPMGAPPYWVRDKAKAAGWFSEWEGRRSTSTPKPGEDFGRSGRGAVQRVL